MSRGRKLLIVAVVLAVGVGLAWPFRKSASDKRAVPVAQSAAVALPAAPAARVAPPSAQLGAPAPVQLGAPAPHVVAKMASTQEGEANRQTGFDLANHPALSTTLTASPAPRNVSPVTPPVPPKVQTPPVDYRPAQVQTYAGDARPAYTISADELTTHAREKTPTEVRHVVQNSDTLEKLAKRYLGSEDRALEIFDLNRDVLDNPHLLPIDAELRIPADAQATLD